MDARLETAIGASLAWYQDVFRVHRVATQVADHLWSARGEPPRWHSAAKTLAPDVPAGRVLRAVERFDRCSVADSFGTLDLSNDGFDRLFEASWVFRPPLAAPVQAREDGWSVVSTPQELTDWNAEHDTTGVLVPALLDHPRFTFLARRRGGMLVAGAVLHEAGSAVELSNTWATSRDDGHIASVLSQVDALHPGRAVVAYARGEELDDLEDNGFTRLGPQVVWVRSG